MVVDRRRCRSIDVAANIRYLSVCRHSVSVVDFAFFLASGMLAAHQRDTLLHVVTVRVVLLSNLLDQGWIPMEISKKSKAICMFILRTTWYSIWRKRKVMKDHGKQLPKKYLWQFSNLIYSYQNVNPVRFQKATSLNWQFPFFAFQLKQKSTR